MNIVSVEKLTKTHGLKKLFEDVSFGIFAGQKIALIGVNGTGKSTLLKLILGKDIPDSGSVTIRKGSKINMLEQVPTFKPDDSILEHIFNSDNEKVQVIKRYELCCEKLTKEFTEELNEELKDLTHKIDHLDAWQYESEIKSVLSELGLNDLTLKMNALSGGMLKKVALAQALIDDSDLIILDEPTNHLDVETIQWLEIYLKKINKTILMVTHDRYMVDNVCNNIYEIAHNKIYQYEGNYSYYLERKAEIENSFVQEEHRIKSIMRVELEWLKRGPKARSTKQKARIQRAHEMMAREKYKEEDNIEISLSGKRLGKKILELEHISKAYDEKTIIRDFSYKFKSGEKIGVVGANGTGKTTFLKLITGYEEPDTGKVEKGVNTFFGYFDQYSMNLNPNVIMLDYIKESALYIKLNNGKTISAGQMLERFLFPSNMHYTPIEKLSGGEKRRLYLLNILMKNPNFLILDEPTNDLDIKTLSVLEDFLTEFDGCLLLVSHDRYFMDRLVDYILIFDGSGEINGFPGSYSDYLEYKKSEVEEEKKSEKKDTYVKPKKEEKIKLSFKEKYELEHLEKDIDKLEQEKKELDANFSSGEDSFDLISKWNQRYKEIETLLETKLERWEYLASFEM